MRRYVQKLSKYLHISLQDVQDEEMMMIREKLSKAIFFCCTSRVHI